MFTRCVVRGPIGTVHSSNPIEYNSKYGFYSMLGINQVGDVLNSYSGVVLIGIF